DGKQRLGATSSATAAETATTATKRRATAGADVEQFVAGHHRGVGLAVHAAQLPELLAGGRLVRTHPRPAPTNPFGADLVLPDQGRAPAGALRARCPPQLLAGLGIEGHQK